MQGDQYNMVNIWQTVLLQCNDVHNLIAKILPLQFLRLQHIQCPRMYCTSSICIHSGPHSLWALVVIQYIRTYMHTFSINMQYMYSLLCVHIHTYRWCNGDNKAPTHQPRMLMRGACQQARLGSTGCACGVTTVCKGQYIYNSTTHQSLVMAVCMHTCMCHHLFV